MTKKTEWELKQEKILSNRKKGLKALSSEQREAINLAHQSLVTILGNIRDMEDIYLSDIREMNSAMWKIRHEFDISTGDYYE
tara:strand:- start:20 stop:265 length:246 start_codon:yes stop_codon:yes gene_type:complete